MKLAKADDGRLIFYCQGCQMLHGVNDRWIFNGSFENPTFSPSILVNGTKMTEKGLTEYNEWCEAGYPNRNGEPFDNMKTICHSFVRNGKIQYLNDCTHKLAGKTIDLLDEEEWYTD